MAKGIDEFFIEMKAESVLFKYIYTFPSVRTYLLNPFFIWMKLFLTFLLFLKINTLRPVSCKKDFEVIEILEPEES